LLLLQFVVNKDYGDDDDDDGDENLYRDYFFSAA